MIARQTDFFKLPVADSHEGFSFWLDAAATRPGTDFTKVGKDEYWIFIRNEHPTTEFLTVEMTRKSRQFFKISWQPHILYPQQIVRLAIRNVKPFESGADEVARCQIVHEPYEDRPVSRSGYLSLWLDEDAVIPLDKFHTRGLDDTDTILVVVFYVRNEHSTPQPVVMSVEEPQDDGISWRIEGKDLKYTLVHKGQEFILDSGYYTPGEIVRVVISLPSQYDGAVELKLGFAKEPFGPLELLPGSRFVPS